MAVTRVTNDRILLAMAVCLGLLAALWMRCVWLQVVDARRLVEQARAQHRLMQTLPARRGAIRDRMQQLMAVSLPAPSVYANPRHVERAEHVARILADILHQDAGGIQGRLEKNKGFVWVARQVSRDVVPAVTRLRRSGVGLLEEATRAYPHGRLAGHLLGFVDIDQRGLEGLELKFNGILQGQDGWRSTLRDARGDLLIGPWTTQTTPVAGYDLVLTIDSVVQGVVEEALAWGIGHFHAKGGSVIVMEPYTGAILAMATEPSYDPNRPASRPADARRNRAVTDLFEPGSVFKVVTASALLERGRIGLQEELFCEQGAYQTIRGHILHDVHPYGRLAFQDIIRLSSNIGTAKAAQRLAPEELYEMIRAFGFGRKTGIDLPGEISGILSPPSRWSRLSPFVIPIGQEIAATPIQLTVMMAVIANGGLRVHPYVVDRIQTPEGRLVRSHVAPDPSRVIGFHTALQMQDILSSVVESGTGRLAGVQGLTVAGKTGTAQKLEPTGHYSHHRYVASFVGFGPVPDPRFVIAVCLDEPRPVYYGGSVAAPMFQRIVEQLVSYWGLPRSGESLVEAPMTGGGTHEPLMVGRSIRRAATHAAQGTGRESWIA